MSTAKWDAIVIGSGIGGLACAAALARMGHRIVVLEQHSVAGGLTQTFSRMDYTWDVGVHHIGDMGPQDAPRAVLDWLTDRRIEMAPLGAIYDIMHFPGGFEIPFSRPETALKQALKDKFPDAGAEIDAFFGALTAAEQAGRAVLKQRGLPAALAGFQGLLHGAEIRKWCGITTAEVLEKFISNPKLRTVLGAQWPDYGGPPRETSFAMHAILMRNYLNGAYYPVGGAKAFASALIPVIESAGGQVRTGAHVNGVLLDRGRVTGVRLKDGSELHAESVFSDAGAHTTVRHLLPSDMRYTKWTREISAFKPSACHVGLYLGLEGDIRAGGATASNQWFYETWDIDEGLWRDPYAEGAVPPAMMVSFASLKDPSHAPGKRNQNTAEVLALTNWDAFSRWEYTGHGHRSQEYLANKEQIERNLLLQFRRRFPELARIIRYQEVFTPLSMIAFTGAFQGAGYGLEAAPHRFLSTSLRAKTPVPGLYLAGQDVATPGVVGAMMGGVVAAAAVEPRIIRHLS